MTLHPCHFRYDPYEANPYRPNREAQGIAQEYVQTVQLPPIQETPYVTVDPVVGRAIAMIYEQSPDLYADPLVRKAYYAMIEEINRQFELLPVELVPFGDDDPNPYADSKAMMDDVFKNNRLMVYSGGDEHSVMTRQENWRFRAVHDYFGHAAQGLAFGPRGEENAWIEHSKMFWPMARAAMTTETRGQNSWVNYGPYSHLPPDERAYAEQKVMILPERYRTHRVLTDAYASYPGFF